MKYKKEIADRYAQRNLGNTDQIAFDCVAGLSFMRNNKILDIGTGSGRSARFLKQLDNDVIGLDISEEMIKKAREEDPKGQYFLIQEGNAFPFENQTFDIIFSSWMILELNNKEKIEAVFRECRRVLRPGGHFLFITNTPGFYQHTWVSIDINHPENTLPLQSGQNVKATLLPEGVVVHDYFWTDRDYLGCLQNTNFKHLETFLPKGQPQDPVQWKDELHSSPYAIYLSVRDS